MWWLPGTSPFQFLRTWITRPILSPGRWNQVQRHRQRTAELQPRRLPEMQLWQFVGTSSRPMPLSPRGGERPPRGGQRATWRQHRPVLQHLPLPQLHRKNNSIRSQGGRLSPGLQSVRLALLPRPGRRAPVHPLREQRRSIRSPIQRSRGDDPSSRPSGSVVTPGPITKTPYNFIHPSN